MGVPSLIGFLKGEGNVNSPSSRSTGQVFRRDYNKYLATGQPAYNAEASLRPQYLDLTNTLAQRGLNGLLDTYGNAVSRVGGIQGAAAGSDIANYASLSPAALAALRASNPEQAGLVSQLNDAASSGLAAGNRLTPEDIYNITTPIRADWAARGLGTSMPAGLNEAVSLATAGEGLRQARQQFGTQTAALNNDLYTNPMMTWLGGRLNAGQGGQTWTGTALGEAGPASPNLFSTDQAMQLLNNIYGNQSANARATAQNNAGLHESMDSSSAAWGQVIGKLMA